MSLDIKVEDNHFIVSDGCEINRGNSNISNVSVGERPMGDAAAQATIRIDTTKRVTSEKSASRFLYYISTGIVHQFYRNDIRLELTCPTCGKTYVLGRNEFQIGEDDYQNATK